MPKILHNERDQEVHGNYITGFPEKKISFVAKGLFFPQKMACYHDSGATLKNFFEILHNERCQEVHDN